MDGFAYPQAKIIRAPNLKRGRLDERITDRVKLERVLGVTVATNASLSSDPNTETVAYPAGCTVVLFNTHTGQQSHIINTSRKTITSLSFSSCGRYLVTGECGHQPAVRVWDLQSESQSGPPGIAPQVQQVAEFFSHKYGINCVAFSPNGKYVVSVGTQHDMIVNVWDWKNDVKVASNKVSTKVKALAFAENGSYFVTVGNRHVKFWFLECGKTKYKEAVPLMGRSAILGEQRNNYFCDVACGKGECGDSTYAITRSGLLCEFNNRRLLDKWVELRTTSANCIAVGERYIFVGCADGIVRCFDPTTLRFITTLPRTHYLGVDVSQGFNIAHMSSPPSDAKYPDTVAVSFDETSQKLTCVYNDHSIYVWDIHNIKRVGKSHSFLYHSACIWGVEMAPPQSPLPAGSFLTCSSDDTIRVWTLDQLSERNAKGMYQRNIYSNELLKVLYIDREMTYLKDLDLSATNAAEKNESYDSRNGVRAIRISPDGRHLASGDRAGNIRIHDTTTMHELCKIEAHDAEVLCLEFNTDSEFKLLASASRDRLIHVFDVNKEYNFLQTLDDHSSSITAVRFLNQQKNLQMVSCGADKSLIFRSFTDTPNGAQFARGHNATGKTTLYDMEVDSGQKHVLTACQDRNVRVYSAATAKHTRVFKGSTGDDGTLIKVVLDRSGIYLATSCTDKSLSVYDYYTGECMATMCGHSELATGLRFTNDCRRLISASGDGCIFVWRVPHDMVVTMQARLSQQAMRQGKTLDNEVFTDSSNVDFYDGNSNVENDYRFSVGALPLWAKKHISDETSPPTSLTKGGVAAPKGRWAQRAEKSGGGGMKSLYTDSIISFPSLHDKRLDSDEKDSSLDSGTETRNYTELRREKISKQVHMNINTSRGEGRRNILTDDSALGGSVRDTDIESTAHDGDIDSDQEYRHQPLYYPTHIDSASGSEFTVTNMDADELRKSQRRIKRASLQPIALQQQPTSISGSQESDDDDDEVSTPSGENTDRNPMSMLSISSESLDQIVNREKYLQSTFESLSGAEIDSPNANKSSISSQYLTRANGVTCARNVAVINAAKTTKNDSDAARKREELTKRIAETRKKLQSVGYSSPLKFSQSIHDLSHIPEKDKWNTPTRKQGNNPCVCDDPAHLTIAPPPTTTNHTNPSRLSASVSLPADLQLCGCYMKEVIKNTTPYVAVSAHAQHFTGGVKLSDLAAHIRPRKLQLDRTLTKYKMHKSLPVSPVHEERSFIDYASGGADGATRHSFSYCVDAQKADAHGLRQICADIEQFTQRNNDDDDEGSFSSDSLEDVSCASSLKNRRAPRRCVSHNEICAWQLRDDAAIAHSASFYLNASNESMLSDDDERVRSNSLESVLSNESECCKSAPLEALFSAYKRPQYDASALQLRGDGARTQLRTAETQTEPHDRDRARTTSLDFQAKLRKFERLSERGVAAAVKMTKNNLHAPPMYIPSMRAKNREYVSKCAPTVLNNRPTIDLDRYASGAHNNHACVLTEKNGSSRVRAQPETTTSLDRHLFTKNLLQHEEPVTHKPPKGVRRHSAKSRRRTTYEYVRKDEYARKLTNLQTTCKRNVLNNNSENQPDAIELTYKEKNEGECENANGHRPLLLGHQSLLNELYDSLDRVDLNAKCELDSLEININRACNEEKMLDSLEYDPRNVWHAQCDRPKETRAQNRIEHTHCALENIDILNAIQRKIAKINRLVDVFKRNVYEGKVRALSSMYESFNRQVMVAPPHVRMRRRNLSLPHCVERRLNAAVRPMEGRVGRNDGDGTNTSATNHEVHIEADSPENSLRRACSLSDLSMQGPLVAKRKIEHVSGKLVKHPSTSRASNNARYAKNASMTRSSSTGVLNQSDSENESEKKMQSRLMRPTISSQNKVAAAKNNGIRKRQSYSVLNLSAVGQEDSSSEENEKPLPPKPAVPPRTRNLNGDAAPMAIRRHSINKDKMKNNRKSVDLDATITQVNDADMVNNVDVSTVQLSSQLCDDVVFQLTRAANNVIELYRRLTDVEGATTTTTTHTSGVVDSSPPSNQKTEMVRNLEQSIVRTQQLLQEVVLEQLRRTKDRFDPYQSVNVKRLNDLVAKGYVHDQTTLINTMQQFSDILLGMMQHKMHNNSANT